MSLQDGISATEKSNRPSSTLAQKPSPARMGFRMPPEWHPHEATWLTWPKNEETWPGCLNRVQEAYVDLIRHLSRHEIVRLLVDGPEAAHSVQEKLRKQEVSTQNLELHEVSTVDSWIRDYGPNFLLRERENSAQLAFNDWKFNAWGEKYPELIADSSVPGRLEPLLDALRFTPDMVLEGGAIDVNGAGICMTTEQCLLNPNRNPDYSRQEIETYLRAFLGVEKVLWLGEGISGDDTDGHVDDLARFTGPRTVVCALEEDPLDFNYRVLKDNFRRLQLARDSQGHSLQVVTLPMPRCKETGNEPLPASYANFYIANHQVLVPVFGEAADTQALEILQSLFRDRRIVGIDSESMVLGMGTLHCLTQQQPAPVPF